MRKCMLKPYFLRVFNKDGSLIETKGIIKQMFKFNIEDPRPFVKHLVEEEKIKIFKDICALKPFQYHKCNIKLKIAQKHISKIKEKLAEISPSNLNVRDMFMYYTLIEETQLSLTQSHEWIKEYLTHKNLNSINPVVLFKSKDIKITIDEGKLSLFENKNQWSCDIQYDKETNSFYI